MNVLDHTKAHQKYFEELTRIPHGSYEEKAYSDYLVNFAKVHNFSYIQDDMWNVIIYKAATTGYEQHEPVLLQAHMDMVCEKNKDSDFDFQKDALQLEISDGWLQAQGTTLGGDDGTGVAYMLAILASETLSHPSLECVFTVQEEVGLYGAEALKKEYFKAQRMINLDDGGEVSTCMSSAGGVNVILHRDVQMQHTSVAIYQMEICGLFGGHSGGEIDKERGNANMLLLRALSHLHALSPVQIAKVYGGLKDNAIPREASITFSCAIGYQALQAEIAQLEKDFHKELEFSEQHIRLTIKQSEAMQVMSEEDSIAFINCMRLLPNGLRHHSMSIPGLSTASMNVGVVRFEKQTFMINCSIRGALESYTQDLAQQVELLAKLCGFTTHREAHYPAWSYDAHSVLREQLQTHFMEVYQTPLTLVAVHGGLECGLFKAMNPSMDIVTIGPIMEDIHTPKERLHLESFDRTFHFLTTFLQTL